MGKEVTEHIYKKITKGVSTRRTVNQENIIMKGEKNGYFS